MALESTDTSRNNYKTASRAVILHPGGGFVAIFRVVFTVLQHLFLSWQMFVGENIDKVER